MPINATPSKLWTWTGGDDLPRAIVVPILSLPSPAGWQKVAKLRMNETSVVEAPILLRMAVLEFKLTRETEVSSGQVLESPFSG
jgi:hypothetical protein